MTECNHRLINGASAIQDGKCALCGNRATLQPFEKMQPGEVDKIFQASCPQCDGRVWIFAIGENTVPAAIDPDCRICNNCGYIHWLRGPNESEVIPLPTAAGPAKKDRVRALVLAMLASPHGNINAWPMLAETAKIIDDQLEKIETAGDSQSRRESPRGKK